MRSTQDDSPTSQEWRWCEEARQFSDPIDGQKECVRYLRSMGWEKANTSTFGRDVLSGKIPMSSPAGWSQKHLNDYARLKKWAPAAGSPALTYNPASEPSYAERMGIAPAQQAETQERPVSGMSYEAARTRKMIADAEDRERKNREAVGQLVDIMLVDYEQREWAQAMRMHLSPMVRATADNVLDIVGGERKSATEIIELVGGDEGKVDDLLAFVQARKPELVAMYKPFLSAALDAFARQTWFTPEMAEAWKEYISRREESELDDMKELIASVGGDLEQAPQMLERFCVRRFVDDQG